MTQTTSPKLKPSKRILERLRRIWQNRPYLPRLCGYVTTGEEIMQTYCCPTAPQTPEGEPHTIIGCGSVFEAEPDDEGIIDCPHCGLWFGQDGTQTLIEEAKGE